jgi:hypothetical protein
LPWFFAVDGNFQSSRSFNSLDRGKKISGFKFGYFLLPIAKETIFQAL